MISEKEKKIIQEYSAKYQVKRVVLFGSSLDPHKENNDIDIAVEGILPQNFFKYYGDLLLNLSKPIDVIDLSEKSKFTALIQQEGLIIYG